MVSKNNVFGWLWFVLSIAGYTAAGFLTHFPSGTNGEPKWMPDAAAGGLIQGAIGGIVIGGLQWVALKIGGYRFGGRWMLAAVIGFALTHSAGDARPESVPFSVLGLFCGILIGLFFWLAQRREGNVLFWVIPVTVTTCAAFLIGQYAADAVLPQGWTPAIGQKRHMIYGVMIGSVQSLTMLFLLRPPGEDREKTISPTLR